MLADGRTLAELKTIASRVYGHPGNVYALQNGVYSCLGCLKEPPRCWGDLARLAEIRRVAREVVRGAA